VRLNGEGILQHGPVEIGSFLAALPELGSDFWQAQANLRALLAGARQGNGVVLQSDKHVLARQGYEEILRQIEKTGEIHVFRDPDYLDLWEILERDIFPRIRACYPEASPMRVQLATLPGGASIPRHTDSEILKHVHRLHVPLITNEEVLLFVERHENGVHLKAGDLYELDNAVDHAVENRSEEERVHLLIGMMPDDLAAVCVHTTKESFAAALPDFRRNIGVTLLCRSAEEGQEHGHVLSVNAERSEINAQKALSGPITGGNPRGGGRGYRGLVQSSDLKKIFVADYEKVNVFNMDFEEYASPISHPAMAHIHAL